MSGTVWTKFYWADWLSDPALRLCSFAAKGLWTDMLCIAAAHDPIGYVAVAGRALDETSIARMTGGEESEVRALLGELDRNGVFSRDRHGRIYSRRMVRDAKRAAIAKKNGRLGGNPSLGKDGENPPSDNPPVKTRLNTQEPKTKKRREDVECGETRSRARVPKGRTAALVVVKSFPVETRPAETPAEMAARLRALAT